MIIAAPLKSMLIELHVKAGDKVQQGQELGIVEAMKMQHPITASRAGVVAKVFARLNDSLEEDAPILELEADGETDSEAAAPSHQANTASPASDRKDLSEYESRLAKTLDSARAEAVAKRHTLGYRSARENIAHLCDEDSFIEYGAFALAAQRKRRTLEDLIDNTPADGLIAGFGSINRAQVGEERSQAAILAYDYTVLAGTQGAFNHKKTDRILELAWHWHRPIIFFTEGGGGRPGDTDMADISVAGLDIKTFASYAKAASNKQPRIAINNGYCFAGNAVLFGTSDIRIATERSWVGMGGPAMIEGGGLGKFSPQEIGSSDVQTQNGVIDLLVADEAEAVEQTKKLLSFFQGSVQTWQENNQTELRAVVPENRQRVYEIRPAIELLLDKNSFVELKKDFGIGMVVGFGRVAGCPLGLLANNPMHLGGAIDAAAAEKAAWFLKLCQQFDVPLLSLCDTPGFMVGPESEKEAAVRYAGDMILAAASIDAPVFMICLRKGYGLGAQAMAAGSFHASFFSVAWPSGEFGGMGLEGAVRLGYRKELEAEQDEEVRQALFGKLLAKFYERGKALSMAQVLEIDNVIDPKDSRAWILQGLKASGYYF